MLLLVAMVVGSTLLGCLPESAWGAQPASDPPPAKVKVAAVQITGYVKGFVPRDGYDPADAVVRYIHRAADDGARLVVFPEYHLGRIKVPSATTDKIGRAAAKRGICVIVGCWELLEGDAFANAALVFDREGKILGKYYKTHAAVDQFEGQPAYSHPPAGHDRQWFIEHDPEWIMRRGNAFPVFDLGFAKVGIATCYDGWFPEPFRILSLKGAEIIVWINGRHGRVEDFIVKTAMFRNQVSMICTNQAYGSGTMIAQWPTTIKAVCSQPKEDYISATLDLRRLRLARKNSRNFQQRRPEIYGEILGERPVRKDR